MTATDIIDPQLHTSSFPQTYVGVGTLIGNPEYSNPSQELSGYFTSDGNPVQVPATFLATEVELFNVTTVTSYTWKRGLPATNTIKQVTAGAVTLDTTSAIAVATTLQGQSTVTFAAAVVATGDLLLYRIKG